jgi:hypothetical protein
MNPCDNCDMPRIDGVCEIDGNCSRKEDYLHRLNGSLGKDGSSHDYDPIFDPPRNGMDQFLARRQWDHDRRSES